MNIKRSNGDRRRTPRTEQEAVSSNLGEVIDLSPCGIRVLAPGTLSGPQDIEIVTTTQRVVVRGEVVWQRWRGFRRREVGLRFLSVDQATAQSLSQIAIEHRLRYEQAA